MVGKMIQTKLNIKMKEVSKMYQTALAKAIHSSKVTLQYNEQSARAKLEELLSQPLLPAEQQKIYEVLKKFVGMEFLNQLAKKYPIVSDNIFKLTKEETLKIENRHNEEYIVKVPLVVQISLEDSKIEDVYHARAEGRKIRSDYDNVEVNIACTIPELTSEARSALAEAIKYSAELTAKAYQDTLVSKVMVRDRLRERSLEGPLKANYNLVWAPSIWNARVVEKDPAIFMRYAGKNLLIHQWEIPEETSLDGLLKEFREDVEISKA